MRYSILVLFLLLHYFSASAQTKVFDFNSLMVSSPVDKKIYVIDVIYENARYHSLNKRNVRNYKINQYKENKVMELVIDKSKMIDYELDTVYLLSTYYLPDASISMIIKTRKGAYELIHASDQEFCLHPLKDSYVKIPKEERDSDYLLYNAVFSWNIMQLVQLIQSSGGQMGGEYSMSVTRFILRNNKIQVKDIINFEPALRWKLE